MEEQVEEWVEEQVEECVEEQVEDHVSPKNTISAEKLKITFSKIQI